jgi:hypothetical protein
MKIASREIESIVHEGIVALDGALIELAAFVADAEAARLENRADYESGLGRSDLLAGAGAARRIAMSIRALKDGGIS